ncbi:MAG: DUF1684 domain-containing protein [Crocinitomicaceae bacterium]
MKNFLFLLLLSVPLLASAQNTDSIAIEEIKNFQIDQNLHYKDKAHSPLTKKDRRKFKGHDFFKIDLNYRVVANVVLTPESDTFGMKTSTDRKPLYRKYGIAHFTINGVKCQLSIYQNIKFSKIKGYENSLFLLFNDQTNGSESYGGGRYIDLEIVESDSMIIDFNQSYNPYCHYNSKYSCPIPPSENNLQLEIRAGTKAYQNAKAH